MNLSWTRWVVFIIWYDYFNPNLRYFRPIGVWYVHADCCVRKRELRNISLHNSYGCFYLTRSSKKAHKYRNIFYHEKDKNTVEIRCRKFWSSVHGKFFFSVDSTTFSFPAIEWPSSNYNISFDARSNYFKSPSKTKDSFRISSSNSLRNLWTARKPLKQWSQWQLDFFIYLNWSPFLLNSVL